MRSHFHPDGLCQAHHTALAQFRTSMNLVGPGPLDLHYLDSRAALADLQPKGRWIDLGTGAGFPGIIFAELFPHVAIDLVDSRQKRCAFLELVLDSIPQILAARPAPITVRCTRAEALPIGGYDGMMARALASPDKVLDHARRLLRPQGMVVLFLQAHTAAPEPADFLVTRQTRYTVGTRDRRSVTMRYTPHDV